MAAITKRNRKGLMPLCELSTNLINDLNPDVKWDVSTCNALDIMKDVGVLPLEEGSSENDGTYMYHVPKRPRLMKMTTTKKSSKMPLPFSGHSYVLNKKSIIRTPSENHFDKLSDEVILSVFEWLPKHTLAKCALVCKRWFTLSCDDSLWKRYDGGKRSLLNPGDVGTVISRGVVALRLVKKVIKTPIFTTLKTTPKFRFSKLRFLDLSLSSISENGLFEILSACSHLKCLSLENCKLSGPVASQIAANHNLEQLNMTLCTGITGHCISEIALCCTKLKSWNLGWTDMGTHGLDALVQFAPHSVERLCISGYRTDLVDGRLWGIIRRCSNLKELDISDCALLTENAIEYIVKGLPRLQHLHCSRCCNIAPNYFLELGRMRELFTLDMFFVMTEIALNCVKEALPRTVINQQKLCTIARPTVGEKRTSIWGIRVRE